jgi:hypothetical protein
MTVPGSVVRRYVLPILAVVVIGVIWFAVAGPGASSASSGLDRMSNRGGRPIALPAGREPMLKAAVTRGLKVDDVRPLGTAGPLTFYRFGSTGCYALGPGTHGQRLASLFCTDTFPSPSQPAVVRLQSFRASRTGPLLVTGAGLAADAVATVQLRDGTGRVVEASAVRDNLFWLDAVPANEVAWFVALNARGAVVHAEANR